MYLEIEEIYWMDGHFNDFTTLSICGYLYTFSGEMSLDEIDGTAGLAIGRMETAEEDGATLEMSNTVSKVMHKHTHQTSIILN